MFKRFCVLLRKIFSLPFLFVFGYLFRVAFYDRKYCTGKCFEGKSYHKYRSVGWRWIVFDGFTRLLLRSNIGVPWPVSYKVTVTHPENIQFHPDDLGIFHTTGTYFQAIDAKIIIGRGSGIASNVGLITANHSAGDLEKHTAGKDIIIGEKCWIGMGAMILPGVTLGNNTIVGAGSVVTKSFVEGNCIVVGNPARIVKYLKD